MGIMLLGILVGTISAAAALIAGHSLLGAFAVYLGGSCLSMLIAATVAMLISERKLFAKDPRNKAIRS